MREQLTIRLQALRDEYAAGQQMLADLSDRHHNLQQTMLRISGAIQVLEEELAKADGEPPPEQTETAAPAATSHTKTAHPTMPSVSS